MEISELPDELLTKILSLLSAKEVVRTCVLSKRWARVWASVPVLIFDDSKTLTWQMSHKQLKEEEIDFVNFVNNVLSLRENLPLDKIKLKLYTELDSVHVYELIRRAASFTPRVLLLDIETRKFFKLPDSIFTCARIEVMMLEVHHNEPGDHFIEPNSISLPSLKILKLNDQDINANFMTMLLSGCPALEELALDFCYMFTHEISSPTLKKLSLTRTYFLQETALQISCPTIISLNIHSENGGGIVLKNMPSLVQAEVFINEEDMFRTFIDHGLNLLGGLSDVMTLKICMDCEVLDLLVADIPNCRTMKNLKDLELGLSDLNHFWVILDCFLEHSPNMTKLSLFFIIKCKDVSAEEDQPKTVAFQREYLEMVQIICPKNITAEITPEVHKMLYAFIKTIGEIQFV